MSAKKEKKRKTSLLHLLQVVFPALLRSVYNIREAVLKCRHSALLPFTFRQAQHLSQSIIAKSVISLEKIHIRNYYHLHIHTMPRARSISFTRSRISAGGAAAVDISCTAAKVRADVYASVQDARGSLVPIVSSSTQHANRFSYSHGKQKLGATKTSTKIAVRTAAH